MRGHGGASQPWMGHLWEKKIKKGQKMTHGQRGMDKISKKLQHEHQGEKEKEQVLQVPQQILTLQPMDSTMLDKMDTS